MSVFYFMPDAQGFYHVRNVVGLPMTPMSPGSRLWLS